MMNTKFSWEITCLTQNLLQLNSANEAQFCCNFHDCWSQPKSTLFINGLVKACDSWCFHFFLQTCTSSVLAVLSQVFHLTAVDGWRVQCLGLLVIALTWQSSKSHQVLADVSRSLASFLFPRITTTLLHLTTVHAKACGKHDWFALCVIYWSQRAASDIEQTANHSRRNDKPKLP